MPDYNRLKDVLSNLSETVQEKPPMPKPLFICNNCGAEVYYQKVPGPCPQCDTPQPN